MTLPYTFRGLSRQLTEDDILEFEKERQITLPERYREFLLCVNGGYPKNQGFYFGDGQSFMLQRLFPLTNEIESYFNLRSINHPGSDAPKGLLTIGTSICGDSVCIGISDTQRGKIFYLDHEERDPDEIEDDDWIGVYSLADDFETFMNSLEDEWAKLSAPPETEA